MSQQAHEVDRAIASLAGAKALLETQLRGSTERVRTLGEEADHISRALAALQEMEQSWARHYETSFSGMVSQGLTAVFGEEITLKIETETKRDTTYMRLVLKQGKVTLGDILDGTGGSIASVLGILMEVMLVSSQPFLRNLVVLDEPFSMVEPDHLPAVGELIHQLNRRLGVQFIINVVIGSSGMVLMDVSDAAFLVRGGKVEQIKDRNEVRT